MYTPNVTELSRHGKKITHPKDGNNSLNVSNHTFQIPNVYEVEKIELQPARSKQLGRVALDLISKKSSFPRKQVKEALSKEVREQNAA